MRIGIAVQAVAVVGLCLLVPSVSETPASTEQAEVRPIARSDSGLTKKLIAGGTATGLVTVGLAVGAGVVVFNRNRFLKMYRRRKLEDHGTIYASFLPELRKVVLVGTDDYPISFNAMLGNTTKEFLPDYGVAKATFETHVEKKKSTDKEYTKSKEYKFLEMVLKNENNFTDYVALVTHQIHVARAKLQKEKAILVDSKQQVEAVKNGFKEAMSLLKYKDSESPSFKQNALNAAYKYLIAHIEERNKASPEDVAKAKTTGTAAATPAAAAPAAAAPAAAAPAAATPAAATPTAAAPTAATPTAAGTVGAPVTTAGTQAAPPSAGTATAGTGPATTRGVTPSSGQPAAPGTVQTGGPATRSSGTPPTTTAPPKHVIPGAGTAGRAVQGTASAGPGIAA